MNALIIFSAIAKVRARTLDWCLKKYLKKKQSITSFCVWGSTGSRIEPLRGDSSRFTFRSPGVPGTHFINLERLTAESSLEPFNGCEPGTP